MKQNRSDKSLLKEIQQGSPLERVAAQSALYDRHRRAVRNYLKNHVPTGAVEDLDQTVWTACIEASLTVDLVSEDARSWIMGIARNKVADYYRKREKIDERVAGQIFGMEQPIRETVEHRESIIELRKAWRALTPEQRLAIFLSDILGVPVREVIRWIGRPQQAIYAVRSRAKQALRAHLERQRNGLEPTSRWLEPDPHHYIVGDLHPSFEPAEASALSKALMASPTELESQYEVGFSLYIHPADEYLNAVDDSESLLHLVLIPRELWENLIASETEQAPLVSLPMAFDGDNLTIASPPTPSYVELAWDENGRLRVTKVEG